MKEKGRVTEIMPDRKKENKSSRVRKADLSKTSGSPQDRVLFLQRTIGNQAVNRLIRSGTLQAKLRIGEPGDIYEQEADRVADEVMKMPEPTAVSFGTTNIQHACPECEKDELRRQPIKEEEEEELQAKVTSDHLSEVNPNLESQIQSLKGGGQPLSEDDRAFFEPRFGYDFSQVRMHTDSNAAEMARMVEAKAFTVERDVVFGAEQYAPDTIQGKHLLAHELTHVIQQNNTAIFTNTEQNRLKSFIAQSFENEIERNSCAIKSSDPILVNMPTSNKSVMRMPQEHTSSPPSSSLPYDPTYSPSTQNCAIYQSPLARTWFTYTYRHNAECACLNTPDEPHNNCVRKCLQVKMRAHLASLSRAGAALPLPFPLEADPMCHDMWEQHVECYRECGCNNEFINYPAFSVMCCIPFPCFFVGGSISWFNACI